MNHKIMGVIDGDDFASYETALVINDQELATIMNWTGQEEQLYDYELTASQINELEAACSIILPRNLVLYLTTSGNQPGGKS
ncbi:hypothetical protein [Pseudomonas alvandae]|jgi:hypothetical protein|uniref:hypothetical protein n=1 Tax=Pseudomonas TaxID=286 RepID=UPI0021603AD6|nr:hypothetical protein [Pseudomonas canavaninivorans]UVM74659.1 hypothetical protein LOY40_11045 [Pseudomonas canavaninivorans]